MREGNEKPTQVPQKISQPSAEEEAWGGRFWDINKELGKATENADNVDIKTLEQGLAEAEKLAAEIVGGMGNAISGDLLFEAQVAHEHAKKHGIETPQLKKLIENASKQSPDT